MHEQTPLVSRYTPISTVRLCELIAGCFPAGVLNCVSGPDGKEFNVGHFLTNHPLVRKVSFTGSIGKFDEKLCC